MNGILNQLLGGANYSLLSWPTRNDEQPLNIGHIPTAHAERRIKRNNAIVVNSGTQPITHSEDGDHAPPVSSMLSVTEAKCPPHRTASTSKT